jgi:hypothetical protein
VLVPPKRAGFFLTMINFIQSEIEQIVTVVAPGGKTNNFEYVALNPRRPDKSIGSFKYNLKTNSWSDFATGDSGKSIVTFIKYCMAFKNDHDVLQWCEDNNFGKKENTYQLKNIPNGFPPPPQSHYKFGKPDKVYKYKSGIVMRFNATPEREKQFSVLTPWIVNDKKKWEWKGFEEPRPIFNIENIKSDRPTIVVEGEKCVEYGMSITSLYNFVSWPGGSKSVKKIDWRLLKNPFIIPDNDESGIVAGKFIREQTGGTLCNIPPEKPVGWDIADGCTESELIDILNSIETKEEFPFDILGYTNPPYTAVYRRKDNCEIVSLSFKNHKREELLAIASAQFWENFCGGEKINAFFIQSVLSELVHKQGRFTNEKIRGYGAWIDNNEAVYNDGRTINEIPINKYKTNYYYKYGERIFLNIERKLFPEIKDILELTGFSDGEKIILGGWCVIATICGALPWRPHIWITADHNSGKSQILQLIIRPLVNTAIFCEADTSEAGIRQQLSNNVFPVLYDEAEGKTHHSMDMMNRIISLARKSSSAKNGNTFKGTPSGKSFTYTTKSCFCFSSINPPIEEAADESRISVLEYKKLEMDDWLILKDKIEKTITEERCVALQINTIKNIKNVLKSIEVVNNYLSRETKKSRLSDQYSTFVAGYWHIDHDEIIDVENAKKISDEMFEGENMERITITEEKDCKQCFIDILTIGLPIGGGKIESIGDIIEGLKDVNLTLNYTKLLNSHGMSVSVDEKGFRFLNIHEKNTEFKKLLDKTVWKSGVSKVLKRIPFVKTGYKTSIWGFGCSCIRIPLDAEYNENIPF